MLKHWTHSSAFLPSFGFNISVWSPVNISNALGIFLAPRDTLTDRIWLTSMLSPPLWKDRFDKFSIRIELNDCCLTEPLQDRCAPDKVKYLVRHRRNKRHFPFFSFNWPSIIGWLVPCRKPTAFSGWLHKKQPHWYSSSFEFGFDRSVRLTSNTSRNPECRNSLTNVSCSCCFGVRTQLVKLKTWIK